MTTYVVLVIEKDTRRLNLLCDHRRQWYTPFKKTTQDLSPIGRSTFLSNLANQNFIFSSNVTVLESETCALIFDDNIVSHRHEVGTLLPWDLQDIPCLNPHPVLAEAIVDHYDILDFFTNPYQDIENGLKDFENALA